MGHGQREWHERINSAKDYNHAGFETLPLAAPEKTTTLRITSNQETSDMSTLDLR